MSGSDIGDRIIMLVNSAKDNLGLRIALLDLQITETTRRLRSDISELQGRHESSCRDIRVLSASVENLHNRIDDIERRRK